MPEKMPRVNPDEILREQGGIWSSTRDQIAAGKTALRTIDEHLACKRSFNQETTLSGHTTLKTISKAFKLGYRIYLFYVGVDSELIALDRIARRVELGGHDIDEDTVRKRYRTSLAHFCQALPYCEEAHVFDNTLTFKRIALWRHDTLAWWGASKTIGSWLPTAMADKELWQR